MLLTEEKFITFTPEPLVNSKINTEVLIAISCDTKKEVDQLVKKAVELGGSTYINPKDYGFMYSAHEKKFHFRNLFRGHYMSR